MDQQKLQELYKLHERAKRMERLGNDDEALRIYLEIHENFFANTSDLYERPAVILEKKHRYDEAIKMCERAIELIQEDKITGTVDQFEKRLVKIKERMGKNAPKNPANESSRKLNFDIRTWKPSDWVKALAFLAVLITILYFILPKGSGYDDVYIDMSEMERQSELEGSLFTEDEEISYDVTESMIEKAKSIILLNTEAVDATVSVSKDSIGFALIVAAGTSSDRCEALAIEFVKALSGVVSAEYTELSGPNALSFGEIYDYYDVIIAVGTSPTDIISKGTKNKSSSLINWRD